MIKFLNLEFRILMNTHFQQPQAPMHPNRFINQQLIKGPQRVLPQSRPSSYSPPPHAVPITFTSIQGHQQNRQSGNIVIRGQNYQSPPSGYRYVPNSQFQQPQNLIIQNSQNRMSPAVKPQSVRKMENITRNSQVQDNKQSMIEYLNISEEHPKTKQKSASPRSIKPNLVITGPPPSQIYHPSQINRGYSPPPQSIQMHPQQHIQSQFPQNLMINRRFPETRDIISKQKIQRSSSSGRNKSPGLEVTLTQQASVPQIHPLLNKPRSRKNSHQGIQVTSKANNSRSQNSPNNSRNQKFQDSFQQKQIRNINYYKEQVIKQAESQSIKSHLSSNNFRQSFSPPQSTLNENKTGLKVYSSYEEYLNEKNSTQRQNNESVHMRETVMIRDHNPEQMASVVSFNNRPMIQTQYQASGVDAVREDRSGSHFSRNSSSNSHNYLSQGKSSHNQHQHDINRQNSHSYTSNNSHNSKQPSGYEHSQNSQLQSSKKGHSSNSHENQSMKYKSSDNYYADSIEENRFVTVSEHKGSSIQQNSDYNEQSNDGREHSWDNNSANKEINTIQYAKSSNEYQRFPNQNNSFSSIKRKSIEHTPRVTHNISDEVIFTNQTKYTNDKQKQKEEDGSVDQAQSVGRHKYVTAIISEQAITNNRKNINEGHQYQRQQYQRQQIDRIGKNHYQEYSNDNKGVTKELRKQLKKSEANWYSSHPSQKYQKESISETLIGNQYHSSPKQWPSSTHLDYFQYSFKNLRENQEDEEQLSQSSDSYNNLVGIITQIYEKEKERGLQRIRQTYARAAQHFKL